MSDQTPLSRAEIPSSSAGQLVRTPTNVLDLDQHRALSENEKILNEVFQIYDKKDVGKLTNSLTSFFV